MKFKVKSVVIELENKSSVFFSVTMSVKKIFRKEKEFKIDVYKEKIKSIVSNNKLFGDTRLLENGCPVHYIYYNFINNAIDVQFKKELELNRRRDESQRRNKKANRII